LLGSVVLKIEYVRSVAPGATPVIPAPPGPVPLPFPTSRAAIDVVWNDVSSSGPSGVRGPSSFVDSSHVENVGRTS